MRHGNAKPSIPQNFHASLMLSIAPLITGGKDVGGTVTQLAVAASPITFTANTFYWMHAEIIGSILHMNIWLDGTAEPLGWLVEVTDTSITGAGSFGLGGGLNSAANSISYD